jgi:hypothetical protein
VAGQALHDHGGAGGEGLGHRGVQRYLYIPPYTDLVFYLSYVTIYQHSLQHTTA